MNLANLTCYRYYRIVNIDHYLFVMLLTHTSIISSGWLHIFLQDTNSKAQHKDQTDGGGGESGDRHPPPVQHQGPATGHNVFLTLSVYHIHIPAEMTHSDSKLAYIYPSASITNNHPF